MARNCTESIYLQLGTYGRTSFEGQAAHDGRSNSIRVALLLAASAYSAVFNLFPALIAQRAQRCVQLLRFCRYRGAPRTTLFRSLIVVNNEVQCIDKIKKVEDQL